MWMIWIRKLFGIVLIGIALYFIAPHAAMIEDLALFFIGLTTLFGGLFLGILDQNHGYSKAFNWGRAILGIIVAVIGGLMVNSTFSETQGRSSLNYQGQGISWTRLENQHTDSLFSAGKPIVMDFYADWCAPCRIMEKKTFAAADVIKAAEDFTMVKVDGTKKTEQIIAVEKKFNIQGYPTILFFDAGGREKPQLRVQEFISAKDLLSKMKALQNSPS